MDKDQFRQIRCELMWLNVMTIIQTAIILGIAILFAEAR